ncbi:MAG: type I restriction-modification system subunit M N-terminal domain-containing protein [Methanomicrobiaceae archaeon]|uniref:Uncharacterized protein n=1 Tax=hydrocarbon metagenome TaxID=938273 RepID=A0A0W8FIN0_9ZZZZ|nr:type I restriction-modification system subunit M N-terminal domain-containing protein [Methanomicrobiaceae archaeon]MDD5420190.1 hypothetical protein [Methanomicrobiaceae archaeon]
MENFQHIANGMRNVWDDLLRDGFGRSKYSGIILPFTLLRRILCVPAPTGDDVLKRCGGLKEMMG